MAHEIQPAVWVDDCPKCKTSNYYDVSEGCLDEHGLECYYCHHKWLFDYVLQDWWNWFNQENLEEILEDEADLIVGRKQIQRKRRKTD